MKKPRHTPAEKVRIIVMRMFIDSISAELCRKHNINPMTFGRWRDIFMECGKAGLITPSSRGEGKKRDRDMDKLKKLIGEMTIANDALKKR